MDDPQYQKAPHIQSLVKTNSLLKTLLHQTPFLEESTCSGTKIQEEKLPDHNTSSHFHTPQSKVKFSSHQILAYLQS